MGSMSKTLGALALASGALFAGDALAGTLDQLRDSKTMRIAYDPDAPREVEAERVAREILAIFETVIRANPDQWHVLDPVWAEPMS